MLQGLPPLATREKIELVSQFVKVSQSPSLKCLLLQSVPCDTGVFSPGQAMERIRERQERVDKMRREASRTVHVCTQSC